jgi:8-oxo-dGTP diphosphatase
MTQKESQIRVGAGAVIINEEGKVFLSKRSKNVKLDAGLWETPGGGVEFGETMAEALKRELMEENGVVIEVGEMLDVVEYIDKEKGDHHVSPAFVCKIIEGTPKIMEPDKCEEIGWFSLAEIKKLPLRSFAAKDLAGFRRRYPDAITT